MRETNDRAKNERMTAEIHALGEYNAFSRPKTSSVSKPLFLYQTFSFISPYNMKPLHLYYDTQTMPLRTVLLDPSVNNFPRSRTRTELMKRIKLSCEPHPSYDLVSNSCYMIVL